MVKKNKTQLSYQNKKKMGVVEFLFILELLRMGHPVAFIALAMFL